MNRHCTCRLKFSEDGGITHENVGTRLMSMRDCANHFTAWRVDLAPAESAPKQGVANAWANGTSTNSLLRPRRMFEVGVVPSSDVKAEFVRLYEYPST